LRGRLEDEEDVLMDEDECILYSREREGEDAAGADVIKAGRRCPEAFSSKSQATS
jgi:hypothetical protein